MDEIIPKTNSSIKDKITLLSDQRKIQTFLQESDNLSFSFLALYSLALLVKKRLRILLIQLVYSYLSLIKTCMSLSDDKLYRIFDLPVIC
jgi:hypothetical protein